MDATSSSTGELAMTRVSAFVLAAVTASAALSFTACSSGDVSVGSSEQALKKKKDGSPTGDGKTCSWDDTVSYDVATGKETVHPAANGPYKVGDSFKSPDGCNDCTCTDKGIACTDVACGGNPGGAVCNYNGKTYKSGETFPAGDGCNSCGCQPDGTVACTLMFCAPVECKKTGCSGEICSDQDVASDCVWKEQYACYATATCERGSDGKCGFRTTPELSSCLAGK